MKILVTGASGFVGQHLVKALKQKELYVVGVGRELINSEADKFFSVPDFTDSRAWQEPLDNCDVVVHLAARVHVMNDESVSPLAEFRRVNVEGTLNLARQAAAASVKRFVFISSIKVNGEFTELNRPFTADNQAKSDDAYGLSKFEAEEALKLLATQVDMDVVIIRPPLIYGHGVKANFANMMLAVKRGLPLPLGAIYNKRSFVYVENLVSLIMFCIDHPAAANQTFLVSDGQDLSTTELLRMSATALGVNPRLVPVPQKLVEVCAILLGKRALAQRLCGTLQVDMTKTQDLLGWQPPFSVEEGLLATAFGMNKLNCK